MRGRRGGVETSGNRRVRGAAWTPRSARSATALLVFLIVFAWSGAPRDAFAWGGVALTLAFEEWRPLSPRRNPALALLLLFAGWALLGTLWAPQPVAGASRLGQAGDALRLRLEHGAADRHPPQHRVRARLHGRGDDDRLRGRRRALAARDRRRLAVRRALVEAAELPAHQYLRRLDRRVVPDRLPAGVERGDPARPAGAAFRQGGLRGAARHRLAAALALRRADRPAELGDARRRRARDAEETRAPLARGRGARWRAWSWRRSPIPGSSTRRCRRSRTASRCGAAR